MKALAHTDSCTVGSAVGDVKVSVIFRGAHTGVFEVVRNGNILRPNADGTVSLGEANTLPGTSILVKTLVNQVGPGTFFDVEYLLQGTRCGPYTVHGTFAAGDPNATVRETIRFRKRDRIR